MNDADLRPLEARWTTLKETEPHLRIRDAAARLGVSEATLLSLMLGKSVRRLRCEPAALLKRLEGLGTLMALTRNQAVVIEVHGLYQNFNAQGNVGLTTGDIDLRLDFGPWVQAYTEEKEHAGRRLRSIQFFDAFGVAIHKLYLEDETHLAEWNTLVDDFLHEDQTSPFLSSGAPAAKTPQSGDKNALIEAWSRLSDPHHFNGMLRKAGFDRLRAFEAAEGRFTRRLEIGALLNALNQTAGRVPVMFFVGNPGCIEIYTGPITNVKTLGEWVNVFDPTVNLHVDTAAIATAWAVEKPSPDGVVSSLEFLDAEGSVLLQMFGKRKPGEPELEAWTQVAASV